MRRLSFIIFFIIALIRGKVKPFLLYYNKGRKGQSQRLSTPWLWFDDAKERSTACISLSLAQRAGGCKEREKKEEKDIDKREAV